MRDSRNLRKKLKDFKMTRTLLILGLTLIGLIGKISGQTWPPAGMAGNGTEGNPWQINTAADLEVLVYYLYNHNGDSTEGKYYELLNDIDLNEYADGVGWRPIGRRDYGYISGSFQGNFNGNGKVVKNISSNRPDDNIGLFGSIYNATIQNLGIENCNVTGENNVGGLVGRSENSTITNCYVTGNVSAHHSNVGGLVGKNENSTLINCCVSGSVNGNNSYSYYVGGLVGWNENSAITGCYTTNKVNGNNNCVGGMVGYNYNSTLINSYATGDVNAKEGIVGGLVGNNINTIITYCYATGNVQGDRSVGGLVGASDSLSIIQNCIAANDSVIITTSGTLDIDRIIGYFGYSKCNCHNNYALNTTVIQNNNGNVPITNESNKSGISKDMGVFQMRTFYTEDSNWSDSIWSIVNPSGIWKICNEENLPFLRWQGIACEGETGIATIAQNTMLQVYPNPTNKELRIESSGLTIEKVEVYSSTGALLLLENNFNGKISVSNLVAGVYLLKIYTDKGLVVRKVVKE